LEFQFLGFAFAFVIRVERRPSGVAQPPARHLEGERPARRERIGHERRTGTGFFKIASALGLSRAGFHSEAGVPLAPLRLAACPNGPGGGASEEQ